MMATSFPVTQDQIIQGAMRKVGALAKGATPDQTDYANISFALNILLKTWVASEIMLWRVASLQVPFVANNAPYQIGPTAIGTGAIVTDRPLRILEGEIVNTITNQTIDLFSLSREQYVELSGKNISFGVPTHFWFQRLGSELTNPNALVTFYPIPFDTTYYALLKVLTPLTNAVLLTDVIDFPAEYYQPFIYCLAYDIADEYPISDSRYQRIAARAIQAKKDITEWGQEQDVEVRFKYDRRGR